MIVRHETAAVRVLRTLSVLDSLDAKIKYLAVFLEQYSENFPAADCDYTSLREIDKHL